MDNDNVTIGLIILISSVIIIAYSSVMIGKAMLTFFHELISESLRRRVKGDSTKISLTKTRFSYHITVPHSCVNEDLLNWLSYHNAKMTITFLLDKDDQEWFGIIYSISKFKVSDSDMVLFSLRWC